MSATNQAPKEINISDLELSTSPTEALTELIGVNELLRGAIMKAACEDGSPGISVEGAKIIGILNRGIQEAAQSLHYQADNYEIAQLLKERDALQAKHDDALTKVSKLTQERNVARGKAKHLQEELGTADKKAQELLAKYAATFEAEPVDDDTPTLQQLLAETKELTESRDAYKGDYENVLECNLKLSAEKEQLQGRVNNQEETLATLHGERKALQDDATAREEERDEARQLTGDALNDVKRLEQKVQVRDESIAALKEAETRLTKERDEARKAATEVLIQLNDGVIPDDENA